MKYVYLLSAVNDPYHKLLKNVSDGGDLHDSHLHCGKFDTSKIIINVSSM